MKRKELVFVLHRITCNDLTNPQNRVTQFINSSEVRSVLDISFNHNPQYGDNAEVVILYEKEVPEPENKGTAESAEAKSPQSFKKRPKPGPLR